MAFEDPPALTKHADFNASVSVHSFGGESKASLGFAKDLGP